MARSRKPPVRIAQTPAEESAALEKARGLGASENAARVRDLADKVVPSHPPAPKVAKPKKAAAARPEPAAARPAKADGAKELVRDHKQVRVAVPVSQTVLDKVDRAAETVGVEADYMLDALRRRLSGRFLERLRAGDLKATAPKDAEAVAPPLDVLVRLSTADVEALRKVVSDPMGVRPLRTVVTPILADDLEVLADEAAG